MKPIEEELITKIIERKKRRWKTVLLHLSFILGLTILLATMIGAVNISPVETLSIILSRIFPLTGIHKTHMEIILNLRLPRVLLGAIVGAALALCGTLMQGLFRNPMADPYVLGVSSGAALGAALSLSLIPNVVGVYTTPLLAFLGGMGAITLVYLFVKVSGNFSPNILLLSGIAVSYLLSAILSVLIWVVGRESQKIILWLLGGLWGADWMKVEITAPIIIGGSLISIVFSRDLNAFLLGEEEAKSLGVNTEFLKKALPVLSAIIAGAAVSFTGSIGFIGLMIPHIMRFIVGVDHRVLLPTSALGGAVFLVWADALARCLMELPVGVITALSGVPFFIYLLKRGRAT